MKIPVKCKKGFNGIKPIDAKKDTITFEINGSCLFTGFEIEDTNGNPPSSFDGPHPANKVWPAASVSYHYSGEPIPADGYLFSYTTNVTTAEMVNVNTAGAVNRAVIVTIGIPRTMGDGSGVIKNR